MSAGGYVVRVRSARDATQPLVGVFFGSPAGVLNTLAELCPPERCEFAELPPAHTHRDGERFPKARGFFVDADVFPAALEGDDHVELVDTRADCDTEALILSAAADYAREQPLLTWRQFHDFVAHHSVSVDALPSLVSRGFGAAR